ncbi:hypothetical protein Pint_22398 [Pistacia integerrima]|uniref:Uncharacterized protein n=1 Tax=Pistacia integerrima TaxID=434235 RepID=A0ACC0YMX5_9ROSI|nr:hypothetical protein Pint_22398 [Pistacia integerrima]
MQFFVDLRYLFPPLMNLIILALLKSHVNAWIMLEFDDEYLILKLLFLLLANFMLFLFLLTYINLRFTAHPNPITVRSGYFSARLTFSLLASIFLPPPLFWVVYFVIIISFPWHGMLWNLLKYIFKWFVISLQSCSTLVITCSTLQQEATPAPGIAVELLTPKATPCKI